MVAVFLGLKRIITSYCFCCAAEGLRVVLTGAVEEINNLFQTIILITLVQKRTKVVSMGFKN
jgi:hypothetical protein